MNLLRQPLQKVQYLNKQMTGMPQFKENKKNLNGRWSKSEHQRFLKAYEKYGKNWVQVQKIVKTRTLTQVRSHAQKMLVNKQQSGMNQSFDSQNSDLISYQDQSISESHDFIKEKKVKRKVIFQSKKEQDIISSLVHLIQQESKERSNFTTHQLAYKITENISLPSTAMLQEYINTLSKPSQFLLCVAANRDYLQNNGNFIDLAINSQNHKKQLIN